MVASRRLCCKPAAPAMFRIALPLVSIAALSRPRWQVGAWRLKLSRMREHWILQLL